ncbi:hypothetical protein [Cupriavidus oxalaticus]|jgi:penicillin amidase|uniref:Uncharacterized protein n=1 Tax=Cupriavidus oxalaticus TaxID=96344 RepID=A0A375GGK1_9BURK|nr:hypothetical protein [Cupriavidus oxalaticus]QRQ85815.1 hypothetical protein JTE91_00445 [Cupriavidus oxalaticus]QRQ92683.1 hypothetical protein JTE92_11900 [Cupriavidus oxalaticus]WQD87206.1 hypothetical protein U0036_30055 [Cupriavidus oxalaticus]SPC19955.1 hypothetical protein CO2235_MP20294 [Cupriavidus oxalaticus]
MGTAKHAANTTPRRPDATHAPAQAERLAASGLEKPATVLVDRWGVPHIYAGTLYDVF